MGTQGEDINHHPFLHHRSRRFHVIILLMTGYFSMALMTSNIGITLSCMINSTALATNVQRDNLFNSSQLFTTLSAYDNDSSTTCAKLQESVVNDYGGSYEWSVKIQGYIVGATFLGGMLSTFPSGLAIDRYSVRHLLLFSVLLLSTASILLPLCADFMGPVAVVCLRFLMGFGEGMMIPGINGMITGWIPLHEKSTAASLFTSGNQLAGIMGNPMSAELCASSLRWPAVFYFSGSLGLLWCLVWYQTVNNSPANSKWISEKEIKYLEHHLPERSKKTDKKETPWLSMISSAPFLALIYCGIMGNMMLALILVYIPVYFKDVLFLEVKQNGFYTALPHFCNLISKLIWGLLMDYLKKKHIITATQACKLSQGLSMVLMSVCFFLLAQTANCSTHGLALFFLCAICASFGLSISGFLTSLLSIAPNYIGTMSSINQMIGFAGRVATPQLITYFKSTGTAEEWKGILVVYSVMTFVSAVVFLIWGSGDIQPWNNPPKELDAESIASPFMDKSVLLEQETIN